MSVAAAAMPMAVAVQHMVVQPFGCFAGHMIGLTHLSGCLVVLNLLQANCTGAWAGSCVLRCCLRGVGCLHGMP